MIAQPIYSPARARIFHLDSPSTERGLAGGLKGKRVGYVPFSLPLHLSLSLSTSFSRPAAAFTWFPRRIMHFVAFPLASTSTVPRLPFLFSTRFPFIRLFDAPRSASSTKNARTSSTCLSFSFSLSHSIAFFLSLHPPTFSLPLVSAPFSIALPISLSATIYLPLTRAESLFFSVYFNERRCPLQTATTWNRPYRTMLHGAITSFYAALPWPDSEPAAPGSFSFSCSQKMLSSR